MVTALFLMPKISSFFSMVGSAMIISAVLRDKRNRKNPLKRILLGMSFIDVLVSGQWLFVNLFYPPWGGMEWAIGTYQTCVLQGAICQFNSASGFYNTMLAFCYLLMIVYEWDEAQIARIEPFLHAFPLAWGLGTMVMGLFLDLYHPAGIDCWIAECPTDALENNYEGAPDCSRLRSWNIRQITTFRLAMFHGPVMLYTVLITVIMVAIYRKVRSIEKSSAMGAAPRRSSGAIRRTSSTNSISKLSRTKDVFWQGVFYAGGFFLTWVLIILIRLLQFRGIAPPETLVAFAAFFIACQGSINALTFFRPLYRSERTLYPDRWGLAVILQIVLDQFGFCCRDTIPLNFRERRRRSSDVRTGRRESAGDYYKYYHHKSGSYRSQPWGGRVIVAGGVSSDREHEIVFGGGGNNNNNNINSEHEIVFGPSSSREMVIPSGAEVSSSSSSSSSSESCCSAATSDNEEEIVFASSSSSQGTQPNEEKAGTIDDTET